jgi:hypothetical protein
MYKQLAGLLLVFLLSMQSVFAMDKPVPVTLNTPVTGTLADDVVFNDEAVFAMPAEIILDTDNDCHVFGFIVLGEVDEGGSRSALGMIKRLVCKNPQNNKGFSIWNLQGDFVPAGAQMASPEVAPATSTQTSPDAESSVAESGATAPMAAPGVVAVQLPLESSVSDGKTIYTVKAGIHLTVNATQMGIERFGDHIYLFGNNLTAKPFKIQLAELPSFGGQQLEAMPELSE